MGWVLKNKTKIV